MKSMSRRQFMSKTGRAAIAAAGVSTFSINVLGANEKVIIGMMGILGRGNYIAPMFAKRDDVEIAYLADPDSRLFKSRGDNVEKVQGKRPTCVQDVRTVLDDKSVDAIVNATPDHWHALGTIWACQAGKDVYVEKPTSHSVWESRKMIEAARKYERIVQVGAQNRSAPYNYAAFDYIRSSDFGSVHYVRVMNSKPRNTIGKKADEPVPEGVDYDLWIGPAPMKPFNPNRFHYNWHWFWDFSGGDIINDGVHQMDIARWMIDREYPNYVCSGGGIHYFNDDQECPDTQTVIYDYDGLTMIFEQTLYSPYMKKTTFDFRDADVLPDWPFNGTRIEIYGSKQLMFLGRHGDGWQAFDGDGKSVHIEHGHFTQMSEAHIDNFIQCIRSRELPTGDVEKLHYSTLLCQYGNIAYRTGRRLQVDPKTEGFVNDPEANSFIKREYRQPYEVPEQV